VNGAAALARELSRALDRGVRNRAPLPYNQMTK
jgi:hypothetical protein